MAVPDRRNRRVVAVSIIVLLMAGFTIALIATCSLVAWIAFHRDGGEPWLASATEKKRSDNGRPELLPAKEVVGEIKEEKDVDVAYLVTAR